MNADLIAFNSIQEGSGPIHSVAGRGGKKLITKTISG